MKLIINFWCYNDTLHCVKHVDIARTAVTAKKVVGLVNSFNAPDIARVTLFYNEHKLTINKELTAKDFLEWWKLRKLGL